MRHQPLPILNFNKISLWTFLKREKGCKTMSGQYSATPRGKRACRIFKNYQIAHQHACNACTCGKTRTLWLHARGRTLWAAIFKNLGWSFFLKFYILFKDLHPLENGVFTGMSQIRKGEKIRKTLKLIWVYFLPMK